MVIIYLMSHVVHSMYLNVRNGTTIEHYYEAIPYAFPKGTLMCSHVCSGEAYKYPIMFASYKARHIYTTHGTLHLEVSLFNPQGSFNLWVVLVLSHSWVMPQGLPRACFNPKPAASRALQVYFSEILKSFHVVLWPPK